MSKGALLIRPIPYADEAPNGILLRASHANGWDTPSLLLKAYQIEYRRSTFVDASYLQHTLDTLGIKANAALLAFNTSRRRGLICLDDSRGHCTDVRPWRDDLGVDAECGTVLPALRIFGRRCLYVLLPARNIDGLRAHGEVAEPAELATARVIMPAGSVKSNKP